MVLIASHKAHEDSRLDILDYRGAIKKKHTYRASRDSLAISILSLRQVIFFSRFTGTAQSRAAEEGHRQDPEGDRGSHGEGTRAQERRQHQDHIARHGRF